MATNASSLDSSNRGNHYDDDNNNNNNGYGDYRGGRHFGWIRRPNGDLHIRVSALALYEAARPVVALQTLGLFAASVAAFLITPVRCLVGAWLAFALYDFVSVAPYFEFALLASLGYHTAYDFPAWVEAAVVAAAVAYVVVAPVARLTSLLWRLCGIAVTTAFCALISLGMAAPIWVTWSLMVVGSASMLMPHSATLYVGFATIHRVLLALLLLYRYVWRNLAS